MASVSRRIRRIGFVLLLMHGTGVPARGLEAQDRLLPDLVVRRADLFDNQVVSDGERRRLRFSNGTANIGSGPLHVYGRLPANPDGSQTVVQRIFLEGGGFEDRDAGRFLYHPEHDHIHVEAWAQYRLRAVLPDDGVGEVVREGEKTSFCLLDLEVFDPTLPNFDRDGRYRSCFGSVQGISVGWLDVYDKSIPGQEIDITGLPDGFYWLESIVDPEDHFLEENEDNNVARIKIAIGNPPEVLPPDVYEPNDDPGMVLEQIVGRGTSSNLGPVAPKLVIDSLSIHEPDNDDYFRFYIAAPGRPEGFLRIDFQHARGDLDLELLDAQGAAIALSDGTADFEEIALEGLPAGWYYAHVYGFNGATQPEYRLTIKPPASTPPSVEVLAPPEEGASVLQGFELYAIRWRVTDPEGGPAWVSVFLNTSPVLDGREKLLPLSRYTPALQGFYILNTAEVPPGSYWVYVEANDGGAVRGRWAPGRLTLEALPAECVADEDEADGGGGHEITDCNRNAIDDACEIERGRARDCDENGVPDECDIAAGAPDTNRNGIPDVCERPRFHRGDPNDDGRIDISDPVGILRFLFSGAAEPACLEAADADNNARLEVSDAILVLAYLFRDGAPPAAPGPPPGACGTDPDPLGSPGDLGCERYVHCSSSP